MHAFALVFLAAAHAPIEIGADPHTLYARLASQVEAAYDSARGGFVLKSQVPVESAVELAFRQAASHAPGSWLHEAETTLRWTHGLMDTLTGGYVQSGNLGDADKGSMDKRADSNGRRLELLVTAWQSTGDDGYRREAARVVDWADRVLLDGRGGFVSAQVGDRELVPADNGPIVHAWLAWAAATHDAARKNFALRSLDRVWDECWMEKLGLVRRNEMGDIAKEPRLEDQVEMGRAYLLAARLCGRPEDGERASQIGDLVLQRFVEPNGSFRSQSTPNKNGSIKKAKSVASENAHAARFLCELSELTQDAKYRAAAGRAIEPFAKDMAKAGLEAANWALAVRASYDPDLPGRGDWVAAAKDDEPAPRKRSVRFHLGH
ncbi:MAG: hypothetical protein E6K80_00350 [Candidatus Eisenbacteria bacterium]|uniref:Alginate lyase domain-containing protein n=1 Tax=Eiseniibacteriota bacterium TaxID=2212470 RepID=A0A538UBS3_UNCEI|nr:MAG: hypothetical protein E6K80_00350 [Candidatus Eisenbacteria bacterium]